MKNNKLTLKALKEELENLKKSKSSIKVTPSSIKRITDTNSNNSDVAGHDIKGSYINRIYMKGSMFWLYIITGVLSYAHKLPYIKKLISLLALWYGKTTIWKILIKIRRIFILFNAIIGVLLVFKTTGFSSDNIFAGFTAMGYTYIELLFNFTKRLFNWFVELFDYKIVPNVPNTPSSPTYPKITWPVNNPISDGKSLLAEKWLSERNKIPLKDFLQSPFNVNISTSSPWYKDWSTYFWIIGIVGVAFIGYKFIIDPLFIDSLPKPSDFKGKGVDIPSPDTPKPSDFINPPAKNMFSLISWVAYKAGSGTLTGLKMLNPLYWIPSSTDTVAASEAFINKQFSMDYDNRYYPFTEVNPFNPWYKKLKIYLLGETTFEHSTRMHVKRDILHGFIPSVAESPRIISSIPVSPNVGQIGLSLGINSGDAFEASTSYLSTLSKTASLPATPTLTPINIPVESLEGGLNSWKFHQLNNLASAGTSSLDVIQSVSNIPDSTTNIIADNLTKTLSENTPKASVLELTPKNNRYSVLTEEII